MMSSRKKNKQEKVRKPFRDTKAFGIIKKIIPDIAEGVADIIPGGKLITGLISTITGTGRDRDLAPGDMEELLRFEAELYALEVQDRQGAREREISIMQSGGKNYIQNILAILCVISFLASIAMLVFGPDVDGFQKDALLILLGILGTNTTKIFSYYFGSSQGSKEKTKLLASL